MAKRKRSSATKSSDKLNQTETSGWSKSKKKRYRRLRAKHGSERVRDDAKRAEGNASGAKETGSIKIPADSGKKQSSLQLSFLGRLSGSRFRELNEELYTTTSSSAFKRFSTKPELYHQYHEGFRHQVEQWPVNPVNVIFKWITSNDKRKPLVIADFGCGDAELAKKLLRARFHEKCPYLVHSFDLVASSDLVTACDMARVPLNEASVDVGVFCLSLMGTNLADFIREAHRVIKINGRLKIAEVRSRFATSGRDELQEFVQVLERLGFSCIDIDKSNTMFVLMEFQKSDKVSPDPTLTFTAKPCIYKRR